MTSRRKRTALDGFLNLVRRLPWWVSISLTPVAYLGLHAYAASPMDGVAGPGHMAGLIGAQFARSIATVGQYLLPMLLLMGAVFSWRERAHRHGLMRMTQEHPEASLAAMDWRDFEVLVDEAFRRRGFAVTHVGGDGADGGIDLRLSKSGQSYIVQCKHWRALKVPVQVVRELYGVMAAEGASGGYVVTSGTFTEDAREFAKGCNIALIDGRALYNFLPGAARSVPSTASDPDAPTGKAAHADGSPVCPACGSAMVVRKARKGPQSGRQFWGCTHYPTCRGTLPHP